MHPLCVYVVIMYCNVKFDLKADGWYLNTLGYIQLSLALIWLKVRFRL